MDLLGQNFNARYDIMHHPLFASMQKLAFGNVQSLFCSTCWFIAEYIAWSCSQFEACGNSGPSAAMRNEEAFMTDLGYTTRTCAQAIAMMKGMGGKRASVSHNAICKG